MNETNLAQVMVGDPLEVEFPRHYTVKAFTSDASRLRDILRKRTREHLTEAELGEVVELRKKIRRADADAVMMLVVRTRLNGGWNWF
jgi:hypothetical protein